MSTSDPIIEIEKRRKRTWNSHHNQLDRDLSLIIASINVLLLSSGVVQVNSFFNNMLPGFSSTLLSNETSWLWCTNKTTLLQSKSNFDIPNYRVGAWNMRHSLKVPWNNWITHGKSHWNNIANTDFNVISHAPTI